MGKVTQVEGVPPELGCIRLGCDPRGLPLRCDRSADKVRTRSHPSGVLRTLGAASYWYPVTHTLDIGLAGNFRRSLWTLWAKCSLIFQLVLCRACESQQHEVATFQLESYPSSLLVCL